MTDAAKTAPYYLIRGGTPLHGEVTVSGAKNAVTKMTIASLLTEEPCTLRNVPLIGDLYLTLSLCQEMGSEVSLNEREHTLSIRTPAIHSTSVSATIGGLNRMAILTVGRCCTAAVRPISLCLAATASALARSIFI